MEDDTEKGIFSQTRDLYQQLSSEARRRAQYDRQMARQRGTIANGLLATCIVTALLAVATLVYGVIRFPDAPLRETAGGYVGKQGTARTRQEYEQFKRWEVLVGASFVLALLTGFGAVVAERRQVGAKAGAAHRKSRQEKR